MLYILILSKFKIKEYVSLFRMITILMITIFALSIIFVLEKLAILLQEQQQQQKKTPDNLKENLIF